MDETEPAVSRNPGTHAEWQDAVNAAKACLLLVDARRYGLVSGGPVINVARCLELLEGGREQNILPTKPGVDGAIREMWGRRVTKAEAEAAIDEKCGRP